LPVPPRTILFAKIAASGAILGLAVLAFNLFSGFAWPAVLGIPGGGLPGFVRSCVAYWFTMLAAAVFLYCSVLTVQGITALVLPRKPFLRLSAALQLAAFGLFFGVYFLQPSLTTPAAIMAPENHTLLACSPSYWFFALFNQLNGSLPPPLKWLALRAWVGLGAAASGTASSLLLCYLRTMNRTVEEPDLVPGAGGLHWSPRLGNALSTAILLFSARSLARSRQHRVALAFYLAIVVAIALSVLQDQLSAAVPGAVSMDFILPTFTMMAIAVFGLRSLFSLPISLKANWVLRVTQLCPSENYIAATMRTLLLFAVAPVWIISASLSFSLRPCRTRHRLTQAVGAERLDVVAAVEGRGVGNRAAAQAAARLPQRGVLALLQPVLHVGQHPADVLDAVNVQRRAIIVTPAPAMMLFSTSSAE
jgi:hypothetical protein